MAIKKTTFEDIKNALWAGANTFRDNIDASNYKDYVLSMLFVKYLSDTFDESVENLKKDYEGIRLERQIANLPFVLKEEYTFNYLLKNKYAVDIGSKISEALTGIESSNAILSGIFRGIDFNSENNLGKKEQKNPLLRTLLDDFADLDLRPSHIETKDNEVPADVVGDAYEYMIGEFATMAGKKAGSFFTPQQVSEVMAQIVAPQEKDRVYDPTCGSGSLLIRAAKKGGLDKVSIYGQEVNNSAISMARMNMFIHDIKDAHIAWGDTLANPQHLDFLATKMAHHVQLYHTAAQPALFVKGATVLPLLPLRFRFHGSAFIPVWIGKAKRAQPPIRSPFLRFYLTYLHGIFLLYAST